MESKTLDALETKGFCIAPPFLSASQLTRFREIYDYEVANADPADIRVGSASTRVSDFVNRGEEFDSLYLQPPLLDACRLLIGDYFKLSTMHARTLREHTAEETLHRDCEPDALGWTLVGFIFMVDDSVSRTGRRVSLWDLTSALARFVATYVPPQTSPRVCVRKLWRKSVR